MFMYFGGNYMWSAALLRILQAAGSMGEVDQAARHLRLAAEQGDNDAWYREWHALAERVERRGTRQLEQGHPRSARRTLVRASLYEQWAAAFLAPDDQRKHPAHTRSVAVANGLPA